MSAPKRREKNMEMAVEERAYGTTVEEMERQKELDSLLSSARKEYVEKKTADAISLSALLGTHEAIPNHPGIYGRAPKLRQQIEIAKMAEKVSGETTMAANMEEMAAMARLAIFRYEEGELRQLTTDEFLDEFDANETVEILSKYLGLGATKGEGAGSDPNA